MKLFIWDHIEHLTENYHEEGGAIAIASTLERAQEMVKNASRGEYGRTSPNPKFTIGAPAHESEVGPHEEMVRIFPNAGCC